MKFFFLICSINIITMNLNAQPDLTTPWEKNRKITATYRECIDYYQLLDRQFDELKCEPLYMTDSGFPLHQVVIDADRDFDPDASRKKGKTILFINNGIHPGEPEGIDATMMLARNLLTDKDKHAWLKNTVVVIIPVYNIDGCLNRGPYSRVNQNGPEAYGFRGNDKNYDLNRDFVKCDSQNARSFNRIFSYWNPDVMIDNHTSNGADYQHFITLITTQEDKLGPILGEFTRKTVNPALYSGMNARNWHMVPYVNAWGPPDENGIDEFLETPRFSSGYAALHHCISFMPETHMLKPFPDRVKSTYDLMEVMLDFLYRNGKDVQKARNEQISTFTNQQHVPITWKQDKSKFEMIEFKGYEAVRKLSKVTGGERLFYDRRKPFTKTIPYYNKFETEKTVTKPFAYIIPQAYREVVDRLIMNKVHVEQLAENSRLMVENYRINSFETSPRAYEGHYLHSNTQVESFVKEVQFRSGDYLVYTDQPAARYVIETLEPEATDSFFNWNFFDGILGQKEYFSDYIFEDLAEQFLKENPEIARQLEQEKVKDEKLRNDPEAILDWVYRKSPWYEPTHQLYPVRRLMSPTEISVKR